MSKLRIVSSVLLLATLSSGCRSFSQRQNDHWSAASIPGRATRFLTGYNGQKDGSVGNYLAGNANDIGLFFRRHFWNSNPRNPFQGSALEPFYAPSNPNGDSEFEVSAEYEERIANE